MDTSSVTIRYRPLRIGWAIKSGDFDAYRKAVRYSFPLWGGRFNPIIQVDRPEAAALVKAYGVDMIMPISELDDDMVEFLEHYKHLSNPFHNDFIFRKGDEHTRSYARVLDIDNAIGHLYDKPEFQDLKAADGKLFNWADNDPLADVFLMQLGEYPSVDEIGTDYRQLVASAAEANEFRIEGGAVIPAVAGDVAVIPALSRISLETMVRNGGRLYHGGFYLGEANNLDDLVNCWNLRAGDIPLWFVDRRHMDRYGELIPQWRNITVGRYARYREEYQRIGLWAREFKRPEEIPAPFQEMRLVVNAVGENTWSGAMVPPVMHLGHRPALGLVVGDDKRPKITFQLPDKPYSDKPWYFDQHLAMSLNFIGGLSDSETQTLRLPYIPELNMFYGTKLYHFPSEIRAEPTSIGVIIDVHDDECSIKPLKTDDLVTELFRMAQYTATPSSAGRIARQLVTRLGRMTDSDIFRIPGVRKLLGTYGLNESFSKAGALQLIGSRGEGGRANLSFKDFEDMTIEPGPRGRKKLTPDTVFSYLVEKGLFRVGEEVLCPNCDIRTWYSFDKVHPRVTCDLCGHQFDAARQLVDADHHSYRRSGVLGLEKNVQGAIPVLLTVQYLAEEIHSVFMANVITLSVNLTPEGGDGRLECESDLVCMESNYHRYQHSRVAVALAECKDQGSITAEDIAKLKKVAMAFPKRIFDTYVILAKLAPFTDKEIEAARTLNEDGRMRAILLGCNELELDHMARLKAQHNEPLMRGSTLEEIARRTDEIYFDKKPAKVAAAAPNRV